MEKTIDDNLKEIKRFTELQRQLESDNRALKANIEKASCLNKSQGEELANTKAALESVSNELKALLKTSGTQGA